MVRLDKKALVSALLAALFVLLWVSPAGMQVSHQHDVDAQFVPSLPSTILVGFSPNTLNPLSEGIPVFSQGDQIWVEVQNISHPISFSLLLPDGAPKVGSQNIQPNTVVLLYSFFSNDPEGSWTMIVSNSGSQNLSVPLQVVSQDGHSAGVSLSSYSIQSGQLNLGFTVPPSDAYDIQGCLVTHSEQPKIQENLPSAIGSATASITFQGSTANISVTGTLTQPFSVWFVFDYTYSYSNLNATQLVSRPVEVARSDPVVFSATGNESTPIKEEAILRVGTYTLETFFDSAQGLTVQETQILNLNANWFSLSSCNPFAMTAGSTIQKSVSIAGAVSQWPSGFISTYDYRGVEMAELLPLSVQMARINIAGNWNGVSYPLNQFGFSVIPSLGIEASSFYDGAIYLAASSFPLNVGIRPTFGSQQFPIINITVMSPFTDNSIKVPVGKVVAQIYENSLPAKGAFVQLANGENGAVDLSTGDNGSATFYTPAGNYSLLTRIDNVTQLQNIVVSNNGLASATFDFQSAPAPASYTEELVISIVIGSVIGIYAWFVMPRQKRYALK